jgi:CheY-like chemotaxis protein/anti-sigma regulatory factor (Ser/Thr protein kinase)
VLKPAFSTLEAKETLMSHATLQKTVTRAPESNGHSAATRVLIVDDDHDEGRVVGALVDELPGHEALFASNGAEALKLIEEARPNVVLTDLRMPGMDGLELVEAIRARYPETPVVLSTAYGSEDIAILALRRGAAHYLAKDRMVRDLKGTLQAVIAVAATERKRRRALRALVRRESRFELESDPGLITPFIALLQEDMAAQDLWGENDRMQVGIALEEALRNALYHGNLAVDPSLREADERAYFAEIQRRATLGPYCARRLRVLAAYDREAATFVIRDEGRGFDTSAMDDFIDPTRMLLSNGRGLILMRTFMDELRFNEVGNVVTMIKRQGRWPATGRSRR